MVQKNKLKNIAVVAHVDHGKTTLINQLLEQSGVFSEREVVKDRVMDSGEIERERGITITAKNCSIKWNSYKINLLDTPGHSDFGGEVERSLMMIDSILLLVDAAEGPLPQTRFVLSKAMEKNIKIAIIINKIDRPDQRIQEVKKEIEDLFLDLASILEIEDFDFDIPILYSSSKEGWATDNLEYKKENMHDILDFMVSDFFPSPKISPGNDTQLLITNLSYSTFLGPLAIGRIQRGSISKYQNLTCIGKDQNKNFKVTNIEVYDKLGTIAIDQAHAGEIVIIAGLEKAQIGDTISSPDHLDAIKRIDVEPPTVSINVSVNTSPLSGRDGEYLTSKKLEDFLINTVKTNVSVKYDATDDPKVFRLKGRGELQLSIIFEELRRKNFEFMLSRPEVLFKVDHLGNKLEPFEKITIDTPNNFTGTITEKFSKRKGILDSLLPISDQRSRIQFTIPSRGLIGHRSQFLTDTKGEGLISSEYLGHRHYAGDILSRQNGAIITDRTGKITPYALFNLLSIGKQFVIPGEQCYEGMVIGEHNKSNDTNVNAVREKHLSSMRTAGKDQNIILPTVQTRTLDWAIDWIDNDEWVEVTPKCIRIRKKVLPANKRSVIRN